jgi:hypothetical protein
MQFPFLSCTFRRIVKGSPFSISAQDHMNWSSAGSTATMILFFLHSSHLHTCKRHLARLFCEWNLLNRFIQYDSVLFSEQLRLNEHGVRCELNPSSRGVYGFSVHGQPEQAPFVVGDLNTSHQTLTDVLHNKTKTIVDEVAPQMFWLHDHLHRCDLLCVSRHFNLVSVQGRQEGEVAFTTLCLGKIAFCRHCVSLGLFCCVKHQFFLLSWFIYSNHKIISELKVLGVFICEPRCIAANNIECLKLFIRFHEIEHIIQEFLPQRSCLILTVPVVC